MRTFAGALLVVVCGFGWLGLSSVADAKGAKSKPKPATKTSREPNPKTTKPASDIPPAQEASSQDDAVQKTSRTDLPLLDQADEVTIVRQPSSGKSVSVTKPNDVAALRKALSVEHTVPTTTTTKYALVFLVKKKLLRKVLVEDNGYWSINRPGTIYPCGTSTKLLGLIENQLK